MTHPSPETAQSRASGADGFPQQALVAAIPRLRRYAWVLTCNHARADDLVQDTLARAWEKRHLWQSGSDLRAWLFTIMHNVFVNQLARDRVGAASVSLDTEGEYGIGWQGSVASNQFDRVELRELQSQISRLPAEQREVLLLVAVEQMRYEEIAVSLGVPIGTVMSRLSRARDKLRRMAADPAAKVKMLK